MNVKLVSLTQSCIEGVKTAEDLIVYTARVSNPDNQLNFETSDKLLNHMIKNKHWSPFDMVDMAIEVVTSRAISHQIIRHWSFSFQEFSQRYSKVLEIEPIELRKQSKTNRQSSTDLIEEKLNYQLQTEIESLFAKSQRIYDKLIENGVAKECARFVLPEATQTRLYMKGSVRDWIHYLNTRCDEHTQKEHQDIANEIKAIFINNFKVTAKALLWT